MTKKTMTYAEVHAHASATLQAEVLQLLHWTEDQYCLYKYQLGIAYLHWYLPTDEYARKQMEGSKLYWAWWKIQWDNLDMLLRDMPNIHRYDNASCIRIYKALHCPQELLTDGVKPNNVVLSSIKKKKTTRYAISTSKKARQV